MKKILAVLLAMLVLFSTCAVSFAAETDANETVTEESDLVAPDGFTQLKLATVFKVFEKFFSFIINLFGDYADDLDNDLANLVAKIFGTSTAVA